MFHSREKGTKRGMRVERIKYIHKLISFSVLICLNYIGTAMAAEEPKYELIKSTDVYEIRYYEDRLAVQTVQAPGEDRAFRRLFNYISGSNQRSSKIAMTTPVTETDEGNGGVMMHFFLPKNFTEQTAPLPQADNVKLVMVKGGYYAVIKYSGRSTNQNFKKHAALLRDALNKDDVALKSDSIKATYNAPFTPSFLRRNEVMYRVDWE